MVRRGVPAVLIATDVFLGLARGEAEAYGYPQLPILVIPHPLGVRPQHEVRAWAEEKAEELINLVGDGQL